MSRQHGQESPPARPTPPAPNPPQREDMFEVPGSRLRQLTEEVGRLAAELDAARARVAELEAGVHAMREAQCGCLGGLGADL